jgi:peptidoglycan/xylan/chitin deacetylase (PgdA/CDA1 family)
MPDDNKAIYLTFDDGPNPKITDWILEQLSQYQAKATFFCEGQQVDKYPKIFNRLVEEEQCVGNHSYSHLNGWFTNTEAYVKDVEKAADFIDNISKKQKSAKRLFRPPYGKIKPSQAKILQKLGYTIVMLDVVSGDFDKKIDPVISLAKVLKYSKPGSIVVFHDSNKAFNTLQYVLPKALKYWSEKGYQFLSL